MVQVSWLPLSSLMRQSQECWSHVSTSDETGASLFLFFWCVQSCSTRCAWSQDALMLTRLLCWLGIMWSVLSEHSQDEPGFWLRLLHHIQCCKDCSENGSMTRMFCNDQPQSWWTPQGTESAFDECNHITLGVVSWSTCTWLVLWELHRKTEKPTWQMFWLSVFRDRD